MENTETIKNQVLDYEVRKKQEMDFVDREMKYLEKMHRYFRLKAEIAQYQLAEITAINQLNGLTNVVHQTMQSGREETKTE